MNFENKDIIAIGELTKEELLKVIEVAGEIDAAKEKYASLLNGKVLASLFFEPSTRTKNSFYAAMARLGGGVIGFSDTSTTSVKKGESFEDTIKTMSGYSDVIVIRHPEEGSAQKAADAADVPVINAGDGTNEHPTQTLLDLYTLKKEKATLEGLKIGMLGDLKNGRTVHSLVRALKHFNPMLYFIAPQSLKMPDKYLKELDENGIKYKEEENLDVVSKELDVLYVTRIQKERFENADEYEKVKGVYVIDKKFLENAKDDVIIMHPLPRVDEISTEIDSMPQSAYFRQAANGIPVRMALLGLVTGKIK